MGRAELTATWTGRKVLPASELSGRSNWIVWALESKEFPGRLINVSVVAQADYLTGVGSNSQPGAPNVEVKLLAFLYKISGFSHRGKPPMDDNPTPYWPQGRVHD